MSIKQKQAEYRQNLIGTDFISTPSDNGTSFFDPDLRVYLTGEILSATNFPDKQIFISYKFYLPNNWNTELPEEYSPSQLTEEELLELNCLQSITHSVSPVLVHKQEGGVSHQFYFCFPFDLQLIVPYEEALKEWPKILFEVFSKDSWDRIYMHGCGFVNIPAVEGTHELKSQTWKPTLSQTSKLSQFFLGGLIRPKNIENIAFSWHLDQNENRVPINRSQFSTESSGTVNFRINIATQSKKVKTEERTNFKTFKKSYDTQVRRNQLDKEEMKSLPSSYNAENVTGARFTNNRLF